MHPFLPVLSVILLAMADLGAWYAKHQGQALDFEPHRTPLIAVTAISMFFGVGLAYWLRRFRIRIPWIFALISLGLVVALIFVPSL